MTLHIVYTTFCTLLCAALLILFTGYSGGPAATVGQGFTGAPGETGTVCGNCHNLLGSYGIVSVGLVSNIGTLPYEYLPGITTRMDITINTASGTPFGYGFQLIMMDDMGNPLDVAYSNLGANVKQTTLANGRTYLEHNGTSSSNVFSFDYEVIVSDFEDLPEPIKVYVTAVAVNANGVNNGDSGSTSFDFDLLLFRLPVELTDFAATSNQTGIQLDWTTETERDNDYFAIEHATNGNDFTTIKTLGGAGTSNERNTYAYTHMTPTIGHNYYRLRMVDFDGKETFSEVVVEKFNRKFNETTVFPQPTSAEASIYLTASTNESATLEVYDLSGKRIYSNNIQLTEGENYIHLNAEQWSSGHYVIHIKGKQFGTETIKFLKKFGY